ncbi:MAG: glycosyltransferase [Solidesulfovibrio magneticus str. Maddingley MBC34]|uniref:Glycosyltransferase n=1 Tax=Solidesulfovibrio magneticus str. Maddingley MBC34 TaxID=1206767 RepID=K6HFB4_9BACT|nr:MAG: glycosyltransferase [Solidesulfovibrio magneticus str. Maddingley MBC34]
MPRLTVVIPAYNAAATLGDALDALDAQTIPRSAFSVIVVDDGSSDATAALARAKGASVISQPNAGPAAARNAGAAAAPPDSDILVFTDADCAPAPDFLARLTAPLDDGAVAGVQGAYRTRQTSLVARFAQIEFEDRYAYTAKRPTIDLVATYAAAYRRAVFDEAGGFDTSFRAADNEDTELSYRLAAAGHRLVFAPDAMVYHRHPAALFRYMRIKASRAFWRLRACREHPEKLVRDGYTPPVIRLQTVLAGLFALAALLAPFSRTAGWSALAALAALLASALPFARFAARRDPTVARLAPAFVALRSLAFAAGLAWGLAGRLLPATACRPPLGKTRNRVGLDLHAISGIRQGSRTYIEALAARLPQAAPDLAFVFYATRDGLDAARALAGSAPNVTVREIPAGRLARLVVPFPWRLAREVDVFHCQYLAPLTPTVPCVVSIHDILHEAMPEHFPKGLSRLMRLLYPRGARRAAMVLTLSAYCRDEIVARYRLPGQRVAYAFPGVDPAFAPVSDPAALAAVRARLGLPVGPYILFLGRMEPRKNVAGLTTAYGLLRKRLGDRAPSLVIAGPDDGLFAAFGQRLREAGTAEGIVFCGGVAQADLPALLSGAAVFAYPSFGEGFGLPVVEAMACGAPVVAGTAPAVPEAAGGAALLVDPRDPQALAEALYRVLTEPELAAELRTKGLARARLLDWNDTAAMAVAAYRRTLA